MGIGLTVIVTTIIKISYGGLRPYFMQACDVDFTKINCTDEYGLPVYVTNYTCRGDISDVREARLS
jgi:phosphatidate phosphatase